MFFGGLGLAGNLAAKVVNGGTRCPKRVDDNAPSAPNLTSSSEKPIHLSLSAARDGGSYNNEDGRPNCLRQKLRRAEDACRHSCYNALLPKRPATCV